MYKQPNVIQSVHNCHWKVNRIECLLVLLLPSARMRASVLARAYSRLDDNERISENEKSSTYTHRFDDASSSTFHFNNADGANILSLQKIDNLHVGHPFIIKWSA